MNRVELGVTKLRRLLHTPRDPALAQYLNLWSLCDGVLIGVDLQFSSVYEIDPCNAFLMEPSRLDTLCLGARSLLNALPENSTVQFIVQLRRGAPEAIRQYRENLASADELGGVIRDSRCAYLQAKEIHHRRHYVFATSRPGTGKMPFKGLSPTFEAPSRAIAKAFHETRLGEHSRLERSLEDRFQGLGIGFRKLSHDEMLALVFDHLNPGRLAPAWKDLDKRRTLREQIARNACQEHFDHIHTGGRFYRGISLFRLPEMTSLAFTQRLLNSLLADSDLCLTVDSLNTEAAVSALKRKNNAARTLAVSSLGKNYESERKHVELDELITEIRGSAQKLFRFSLSVLLRSDSLDDLRDRASLVEGAFHDLASAEGRSDDMNHGRLYLGALPGHGDLNDRKFYIQTNALAGLLPLSGMWKGSAKKKMLLETPLGEVVGLDPFDAALPAKHGIVIGTTGSGKSFLANFLLGQFMAEDRAANHVVVIDIGGSYRKLARSFGGAYLEVSASEEFGFNPFPRKVDIFANGEFDSDAVAYLTLLVSKMCLLPGHTLPISDKGFLEKAIHAAYMKKEEVLLSDLRAELALMRNEHPDAKGYADSLEIWTTGMYGKLFNRPGGLDIANRLLVFDLQNLENHPDLQSIYFFVIRSLIWGKLLDRSLRKIIAIDEGWKFFNDDIGRELIENLYRTARKFNAGILSISQSPKDFLDSKAANAIVANSYVKYILKLAKGHELLEQFELNANEIAAVRELQSAKGLFSDVLVKYGEHSIMARVEPTPFEYWLCTTDPQDRLEEDRTRAANPGLSETRLLMMLAGAR